MINMPQKKMKRTCSTYEDFLYDHCDPSACYIDSKVLGDAFGVSVDSARKVIVAIPTHKYIKAADRSRASLCVTYKDLWKHLSEHPMMVRKLNKYVLAHTPANFEEIVQKGRQHKEVAIVRDYGVKKYDKKLIHMYNKGLKYSEIVKVMKTCIPDVTDNAVIERIKLLVREGHTDDIRNSAADSQEQEIILKLYTEKTQDINAIAKELGRSRTTIIRCLEKNGYTGVKTPNKYMTKQEQELILNLYKEQNHNVDAIAQEVGRASITIIRFLEKNGYSDIKTAYQDAMEHEQKIIVKLYTEHTKDINEIAKKAGRARSTVVRLLERMGYTDIKVPRKYPTAQDKAQLKALHAQGLSATDISRMTDWCYSTVYRAVNE